jgi:DNA-directed RNA polymerase specialized sigma24 family protein
MTTSPAAPVPAAPVPPAAPGSAPVRPAAPPTAAAEGAAAAFEALYLACCARLVQQTFLLTGHRIRSDHCVHRAFQLAWNGWDTVAGDASPEGWVRATAFDLALSPWHRSALHGPDHASRLSGHDRELLGALLQLPRAQRRALVLHDALGLSWEQTAAEIEASTPTAYGRVIRARRTLVRTVPAVSGVVGADVGSAGFGRRLGPLLRGVAVRGCPQQGQQLAAPSEVGRRARRKDRGLTGAAVAVGVVALGALVAGVLLGTPWHPPRPPFITHLHPAGKAAARAPSVAVLAPVPEPPFVTAPLNEWLPQAVGGVRMPVWVPGWVPLSVPPSVSLSVPASAWAGQRGGPAQDARPGPAAFLLLRPGTAVRPQYGPPLPEGRCLLVELFCPHPHPQAPQAPPLRNAAPEHRAGAQ